MKTVDILLNNKGLFVHSKSVIPNLVTLNISQYEEYIE